MRQNLYGEYKKLGKVDKFALDQLMVPLVAQVVHLNLIIGTVKTYEASSFTLKGFTELALARCVHVVPTHLCGGLFDTFCPH